MKFKFIIFAAMTLLLIPVVGRSEQFDCRNLINFDAISDFVGKHFYDQTFKGTDWKRGVLESRSTIQCGMSDVEVKAIVNRLLSSLHASHTALYTPCDQYYWALGSIFSLKIDGAPFPQIGAWFKKVDEQWFVQNVFESSIAARSGLKIGDEVVSLDGQAFEPVGQFREKKQLISIRHRENGSVVKLRVRPNF